MIKRNFDNILADNDENYLLLLENIVGTVDELSYIEIWLDRNKMRVRIATTLPKYNDLLLRELLKFHNTLNIRLDLSKSIKTTGIIDFNININ